MMNTFLLFCFMFLGQCLIEMPATASLVLGLKIGAIMPV